MIIVTDENGTGVTAWQQPLGVACKCGHRGLVPLERLGLEGSMKRVKDRKWRCSQCAGTDVELVLFANGAQADAFWEGLSYADIWDLRLYGRDLTEMPWKLYADDPNPFKVDSCRAKAIASFPTG